MVCTQEGISLPRPPWEEQLHVHAPGCTRAVLTVPLVRDLCPVWIQAGFLQRCYFSSVEISNWEVGLEQG